MCFEITFEIGYFCPSTNSSRGNREVVVVMVMRK